MLSTNARNSNALRPKCFLETICLETSRERLAEFAKLLAVTMFLLAAAFVPVQSRTSSDQRVTSTFTSTLDANTFLLQGGCRTQLVPIKVQGQEVFVQFHSSDPVDFFIMSKDQWLHAPSGCLQLSVDTNTILTVTDISGSYIYHFYPSTSELYWAIFLNRNARDVSISYTFLVGAVGVTVGSETATGSTPSEVFPMNATSVTSTTESLTTSSSQPQSALPSIALIVPLTVIIVAVAITLYRRKFTKARRRET